MKKRRYWDVNEEIALSALDTALPRDTGAILSHGQWIRALRHYLRMTQEELAERSRIQQSHLVAIESEKVDPQIRTLRKLFKALSCDLMIHPLPQKPLQEVLRDRARAIALKRLKQAMGTMALENQAPEKQTFKLLLEKRTDDILKDPRERLWNKKNDG